MNANKGTVTKLSGNRTRPYIVKKNVNKKQIIIGYAETKEEGYAILYEYNRLNWNVDNSKMTMEEVYNTWRNKNQDFSASKIKKVNSAWNKCTSCHNIIYKDIKVGQMQECIDNCEKGYATQQSIKELWKALDEFAKIVLDIPVRECNKLLKCDKTPNKSSRSPFTLIELEKLWAHVNDYEVADIALIMCYSGFRITEILEMKTENIDLENMTFKGGIKTDAGKDRIVPIHSKIQELVKKRYNPDNKVFVPGSQTNFRYKWKKLMNGLGMDKTPHECRHTFETLLDAYSVNRKCIDLMLGHVSNDIGNRIYNHKTIDDLKIAIEMIEV